MRSNITGTMPDMSRGALSCEYTREALSRSHDDDDDGSSISLLLGGLLSAVAVAVAAAAAVTFGKDTNDMTTNDACNPRASAANSDEEDGDDAAVNRKDKMRLKNIQLLMNKEHRVLRS